MSDIVIVSGARTPMGGFQGSLSSVAAVDLGAAAIRAAVERAGIAPADVQEVIMGCVLPAGLKQGPARQASLNAGLPAATGCTTIVVGVARSFFRAFALPVSTSRPSPFVAS